MLKYIDQEQLERLITSVWVSRRDLMRFRENAKVLLDEYVGAHYFDSEANLANDKLDERCVPVNVIYFAATIYSHILSARTPQCYISTSEDLYASQAYKLMHALNKVCRDLKLGRTINEAVINALFGVGVIKVGLTTYGESTPKGFDPESGVPFCEVVGLDDFVIDMSAMKMSDIAFIGNRRRVPLSEVKADARYDKKIVKRLSEQPLLMNNPEGDTKQASISRRQWLNREFDPHIEIMDLYLPSRADRPALLMEIPMDGLWQMADPLWIGEYEGPCNPLGPYHLLSFTDVPSQLIGVPPAAQWLDQHHLINCLWRKMGDQALRQKTITTVMNNQEDDAKRITSASDGDAVAVSQPQPPQQVSYGGADQASFALATSALQLFKNLNGNLDSLAGLGIQAPTATQDQQIFAAANKQMEGFTDRTLEFALGIMKSIAYYLATDPLIKLPIKTRIEEWGTIVKFDYEYDENAAKVVDDIQILPYSMQYTSPSQRLASLMQFINTIGPMAPVMQQQGIQIRWDEFVKLYGELGNMDELRRIIQFTTQRPDPQQGQGPTGQYTTRAPAVTRRENVRISRPGNTVQGQENALIQAAMGNKLQPNEAKRAYGNVG